jgi:hypothetical protein
LRVASWFDVVMRPQWTKKQVVNEQAVFCCGALECKVAAALFKEANGCAANGRCTKPEFTQANSTAAESWCASVSVRS